MGTEERALQWHSFYLSIVHYFQLPWTFVRMQCVTLPQHHILTKLVQFPESLAFLACSGKLTVTFTISHLNQNIITICDNFKNLQGLFSSPSIFSSIVVAAFISRGRRVTNLMRSMAPHQTQSAEKHKFIPRRSRVIHSYKVTE